MIINQEKIPLTLFDLNFFTSVINIKKLSFKATHTHFLFVVVKSCMLV